MRIDIYMFITLISAIALTILGFQLCGVHIPRKEETSRLRTARIILAASYFILAVPAYAELFTGGQYNRKIVAVFTIATAAYQSLLFTATLLTLIRPLFVTRRKVLTQTGIVTVAVALFVPAALTSDAPWIFYMAVTAYAVQLAYYTIIFRRKYVESLARLEDYYDDDLHGQLRWAKFGFYAALAVGIVACISSGLPSAAFNVFTMGYIVFYTWFANRFVNYVAKLNYYLPAVANQQERVQPRTAEQADVFAGDIPVGNIPVGDDPVRETSARDVSAATELSTATEVPAAVGLLSEVPPEKIEELRLALEQWVAARGYIRQEEGREQIARELGTDEDFLRWYFSTQMPQDFRSWRAGLRIEYAKELLAENPDISMNTLAREVGFSTRSNFYGHFKRITGKTPAEYQQHITPKR
ncbi:helix-turn-helix domain-containing protein [Parabacteroides pacaensis]|uniref:helix-turn-helix domain-containing protein n=1 Tax=Parabacteroides pacaensis TaxID=2086575 RepID=UPI001F217729|nr:helix-turn-helix domain-containing protein [Parabacteroides pacaensis]